jgi:hypothetical protein
MFKALLLIEFDVWDALTECNAVTFDTELVKEVVLMVDVVVVR